MRLFTIPQIKNTDNSAVTAKIVQQVTWYVQTQSYKSHLQGLSGSIQKHSSCTPDYPEMVLICNSLENSRKDLVGVSPRYYADREISQISP